MGPSVRLKPKRVSPNWRLLFYGSPGQVEQKTFEADSTGKVSMTLVDTDGMTGTHHYIVDIGGILKEKVTVPAGSGTINYKDLPRV